MQDSQSTDSDEEKSALTDRDIENNKTNHQQKNSIIMNKTYVSPAIAVSEATAKYPTMILISGRVDNPEVSDSKRRYGLDEDESGSSSESWGTIW